MRFLRDIVVVRVMEKVISDGGIIVLDPVRVANVQPAIVIALGSKCKLDIVVGDIVYVSIYVGTPRKIDGLDVRVYDSEDVLAKQTNKQNTDSRPSIWGSLSKLDRKRETDSVQKGPWRATWKRKAKL